MERPTETTAAVYRSLGVVAVLLFALGFIWLLELLTSAHKLLEMEGSKLVGAIEVLVVCSCVASVFFGKAMHITLLVRRSHDDAHSSDAKFMIAALLIFTPVSIILYIAAQVLERVYK